MSYRGEMSLQEREAFQQVVLNVLSQRMHKEFAINFIEHRCSFTEGTDNTFDVTIVLNSKNYLFLIHDENDLSRTVKYIINQEFGGIFKLCVANKKNGYILIRLVYPK